MAHMNLRRQAVETLIRDTEERAETVSYCFGERKHDLKDLLARREIPVFFENRALGMSMEYGLGLSLFGMKRQLRRFVASRTIGADEIYSRVVFLDRRGKILADTHRRFLSGAPETAEHWQDFLNRDTSGPPS